MSAVGVWIVRDGEDQEVGHYRGVFRRERRAWRLLHLDVGEAPRPADLFNPYCHVVGDVDERLINLAAEEEAKAETGAAAAEPEGPASPIASDGGETQED